MFSFGITAVIIWHANTKQEKASLLSKAISSETDRLQELKTRLDAKVEYQEPALVLSFAHWFLQFAPNSFR